MAKIGEGHISAMGRQGMRELRAAMYPESNVAQPAEYGIYLTKTPGEVEEARRPDERDLEEEGQSRSIVDERLERAKDQGDRDDGTKDRDLER